MFLGWWRGVGRLLEARGARPGDRALLARPAPRACHWPNLRRVDRGEVNLAMGRESLAVVLVGFWELIDLELD